jgi:DNA-binding SARP family transcriptional activator
VLHGSSAALLLAALVVGVPWALVRYVGWPLPERMPTGAELELHLFGPLSSGLLLNVLACACWVAWAAFTLDVARCTAVLLVRGVGNVRVSGRLRLSPSRLSPTYALAAVLVGTVALSILGNRLPPRDARSAAVAWPVALTAGPGSPGPAPLVPVVSTVSNWTGTEHTDAPHDGQHVGPGSARLVVVRVPDPVTGVHDSLWRIADRTLGDGARWPEIFEINRGKPQPGGGTFTRPSLIYPGEELILPAGQLGELPNDRLPTGPDVPPTAPTPTPTPTPAPIPEPVRPQPPEPSIPETVSPMPPPTAEPVGAGEADPRDGAPALVWDPVAFTGLGLAAAVSAALMAVRRRHRRHYRPGSGRRDDLPAAPVVYQLRLAHLRAEQPDLDEPAPEGDPGPDDDRESGGDEDDQLVSPGTWSGPITPRAGGASSGGDAERIALAAASTRGLGLTGPGAPDALRALLLTLLAGDVTDGADGERADLDEGGRAVRLLVPRRDIVGLLCATADLPAAVEVHDTLNDALEVLESEAVARAAHPPTGHAAPLLVLVARVTGDNAEDNAEGSARLQAVLDNGSEFGITALLLGQWRSGSTLHVQRDGTVTATGPGPCAALRGTRLLTLDRDAAGRIVELLHDAAADTAAPGRSSSDPSTVGAQVPNSLEIDPHPTEEQDEPPPSPVPPPPPPPARIVEPAPLPVVPLRLVVLGAPRLMWHPRRDPGGSDPDGSGPDSSGSAGPGAPVVEAAVEITGRLQPRARELLVHLALHPDGVSRESVATALWPDSTPGRTTNALNTALTRLRQTLTQITRAAVGDVVRNSDGRLTLDPDVIDVDYWRFDAAVTARRAAGTDEERVAADQLVVDAYGGELAEGTPYGWIEIAREAVRRDAIDSAAALARAFVPRDPQRTLDLLEIARAFDPVNEMIYRDIMRLQSRLGRPDAISRTLALLTARLGEIGDQPDVDTIDLARRLQRRGTADEHGSHGIDDSDSAPPDSTARVG